MIVWLRRNLFRSLGDSVVSIVAGSLLLYVLYRLARFILVTGRWEIIERNLTLFMVGRYDRDELWRPSVALIVFTAFAGLLAGAIHSRQVAADRAAAFSPSQKVVDLVERLWPAVLVVLLLLALAETVAPWLVVGMALAAAVIGRLVGGRLPRAAFVPLIVAGHVAAVAMIWLMAQAQGWDDWGGIMLNIFLAAVSIALCFPLGVLLALGRRSQLPVIRALATAYIELFRGVPLIALLLMAHVALGFFVPRSLAPGTVVRAIVVFTLFTAAYVAEIVRGGLQSVSSGQIEAGKAVGLSPIRVTFLIVLPQALRNVIPALVGQFISLFKDTTLAGAAMGLIDLLRVRDPVTSQEAFRGQGLIPETLAFVLLLFWAGSYTMSRESQRLEAKLGVGQR